MKVSIHKLSVKILLAYAAVLVLLLAYGGISFWKTRFIVMETDEIVSHVLPVSEAASDIKINLLNQETAVRGFIISGQETFLSPFGRSGKAVEESLRILEEYAAGHPQAKPLIEDLKLKIDMVESIFQKQIDLVRAGLYEDTVYGINNGKYAMDGLWETFGRLETLVDKETRKHHEASQRAVETQKIIGFAAVLAFALGGLILLFLQKTVLSRLDRLISEVSDIGFKKDFSARVLVSGKDELSRLAGALNWMLGAMEKSQGEIKKSQERFRVVFEGAATGIALTDLQGNILESNPAFEKMLGYGPEEIRRKNIKDITYPGDWYYQSSKYRELMYKEAGPFQLEKRYVKKDGQVLWARLTISHIHDEAGQPLYVMGMVEDITGRKKAEENQARLTAILEATPDLVATADCGGKVLYCNRSAREMLGIGEGEDISGLRIGDIHPAWANEIVQEEGIPAAIRCGAWSGETAFLSRDGSEIPVLQVIIAHRGADGRVSYLSTVARDIANRKKAEKELMLSNEQLAATLAQLKATEEELRYRYEELQKKEKALLESERRFRTVLEKAQLITTVLDSEGRIILCNDFLLEMTGWKAWETVGRDYFDIFISPERREEAKEAFLKSVAAGVISQDLTGDILTRKGERLLISWNNMLLYDLEGRVSGMAYIGEDITLRRPAEEMFKNLSNHTPAGIYIVQDKKFQYCNPHFVRMSGFTVEECLGRNYLDFVVPEDREVTRQNAIRMLKGEITQPYEYRYMRKSGETGWLMETVTSVMYRGKQAVLGCYMEITERKQMEEKLKYLSLHDHLTGLFNRAYFEEEMRRYSYGRSFPLGIIICDVDGLKLVNDTLGHDMGDALLKEVSSLIKGCFRRGDMVARIGGDEFAILLPYNDTGSVETAAHRIRKEVEAYNATRPVVPISLSIGFAAAEKMSKGAGDLFREADNNMYREKLHRGQSIRSAIVQTMMKALEARDHITEGHADRLQDLMIDVGKSLGLPDHVVADLRLFAQVHDIGKVGIPDSILFKPGSLTSEEYAVMRRHCEIGHRIALSSPDLAPVADWILKHHEWWDGNGYPLGLKGEEIPLACRILSIADAYDAMTSNRPYRKAMSHEEAVNELKRCAGTQFDPGLLSKFLKVLF